MNKGVLHMSDELEHVTVANILGWGSLDIKWLEKKFALAQHFGIGPDMVKESIEDNDLTDINVWINQLLDDLFNQVTDQFEEYIIDTYSEEEQEPILEKLETLKQEFNPIINYMDSWFNNLMDEVDFEKSEDDIFEDIKKRLEEQA
jgi:hypothetical protein